MTESAAATDHIAITHTIQEVARAFDEKLHEQVLPGTFTDNAVILYRLRGARIDFTLPDGVAKFKHFHDLCYWTQHLVSPQVLVIEGDNATARTPVHAVHLQIRNDGSHNQWVIAAVYHDELVRDAGTWRIARRVALCPYVEGDFLTEGVRAYPTLPDLDAEMA